MKEAIRRRLERVAERRAEVERLLADPELLGRSDRFRELSMEFARIDPIARGLERLAGRERELAAARAMAADPDAGLRALAEQEVAALESATAADEAELQRLLVPPDPLDDHNIFLEIRAAAGGDEAAIFAGDLYRMYARYAERQGWRLELMSSNDTGVGGLKEVIAMIEGRGVYSKLKYESGVHRVQRVPATEASGRVHTSTVTVAVLPEAEEVDVHSNGGETGSERVLDHVTGAARVLADDDAVAMLAANELEPGGHADAHRQFRSQFLAVREPTNAIRAKVFARHENQP